MDVIDNIPHEGVLSTGKYLDRFIDEQRYLMLYEIRSLLLAVFSKHADYFKLMVDGKENHNRFFYYCDRTIKDRNNRLWHAHQIIEPLVFDRNNKLISYFSTVNLCWHTKGVPFRSGFDQVSRKAERTKMPLNLMFGKLRLIKKEMANFLKLSQTTLDDYSKFLYRGMSTEAIALSNGVEYGTITQRRTRFIDDLKKHFPILTAHYENDVETPTKDGDSKKRKETGLNPVVVGLILHEMGFIFTEIESKDWAP
jgi:hypothetical protein